MTHISRATTPEPHTRPYLRVLITRSAMPPKTKNVPVGMPPASSRCRLKDVLESTFERSAPSAAICRARRGIANSEAALSTVAHPGELCPLDPIAGHVSQY